MKIIHYYNIIGIVEGRNKARKELDDILKSEIFDELRIVDNLEKNESFKRDRINDDLWDNYRKIMIVMDYQLFGKKILDLGCGATGGNIESKEYNNEYEPWLCRALYQQKLNMEDRYGKDSEYGTMTQITGVDCADLSKEVFPNKRLNLLEKNVLINNFEEQSFDLITSFMLFNSPELEKRTTGQELSDASLTTALNLKKTLLPQIRRLLKPEGIFLYNGHGRELFQNEPEFVTDVFRNNKNCVERFKPVEGRFYG
jgi:SAM-dependent methyltransferase